MGTHTSTRVTRVNPLGPSIPPYGNTKSGGITPTTSNARFEAQRPADDRGSPPKRRRQ